MKNIKNQIIVLIFSLISFFITDYISNQEKNRFVSIDAKVIVPDSLKKIPTVNFPFQTKQLWNLVTITNKTDNVLLKERIFFIPKVDSIVYDTVFFAKSYQNDLDSSKLTIKDGKLICVPGKLVRDHPLEFLICTNCTINNTTTKLDESISRCRLKFNGIDTRKGSLWKSSSVVFLALSVVISVFIILSLILKRKNLSVWKGGKPKISSNNKIEVGGEPELKGNIKDYLNEFLKKGNK